MVTFYQQRQKKKMHAGLSNLEKLCVLEDSFESRLRDKELKETIGIGLRFRQNIQTRLKDEREQLNSKASNRWRKIVQSHMIDVEDADLGIDRKYLCLLRDRDEIDDSDLRLMTNGHDNDDRDDDYDNDTNDDGHHSMPFGLWRSNAIKDSQQSSAMKRWLGASLLGQSS